MHQRNNIFYKLYTNKDGSLIGVDIISILMVGLKGHLSIKHFYLFIFSIFTYSACTTIAEMSYIAIVSQNTLRMYLGLFCLAFKNKSVFLTVYSLPMSLCMY